MPFLALALESRGHSATEIGVNGAASALAVLLFSSAVPGVLDRFGTLRSMYGAIAIAALLLLLLPLFPGLYAWFFIRLGIGAAVAVHWIISETWIVSVAPPEKRGRAISFYVTVLVAGFAVGPLLIALMGTEGLAPYLTAAAMISLSAIPLLFVGSCVPSLPPRTPASYRKAFVTAPSVITAAMLAGFTDTAVLTLLPIYGLRIGLEPQTAIVLLSVMLVGSLLLQWPIGWLADHMDRRRLMTGCGVIFVVAPLVLPSVIEQDLWRWPLLFLWGGASLGLYTLALTMLGDRFSPATLAGANAAMVAVYELGATLGPLAGGKGMDAFGPNGLMWVLSGVAFLFLCVAFLRSILRTAEEG